MKDINETIFEIIQKVKTKRISIGLSHESIANEIGISPSAYNKIERQETKLTLHRLLQIQQILDLSFPDLFDISTETVYNQSIKDNGIGYQQEIENLYQDNKQSYEKHIASLEKEVVFLRQLLGKELLD